MRKISWIALSALLVASGSNLLAQNTASSKGYSAVTQPSLVVPLSFDRPGRVAEMKFDMGDEVKASQLVAKLDDREEQAALAIDKSKADDQTTIEAQIKIAAEKAVEAKNMEGAGTGVGAMELSAAKLQADVEQARVDIAKVQHEQDQMKYKQSQIAVEKMKLYSPIDGIVNQRLLEEGQNAEGGNMKALVIVQVNPLRIDVPVPIADAAKLSVDQVAEITFGDKTAKGKITRRQPVGDAASGTVIVRVEVENPEKRTTGEKVFVKFPTDVAAK